MCVWHDRVCTACLRRRHERLNDAQAQAQAAVGAVHHHVLNVPALAAAANELELHHECGSGNDLLLVQVCSSTQERCDARAYAAATLPACQTCSCATPLTLYDHHSVHILHFADLIKPRCSKGFARC